MAEYIEREALETSLNHRLNFLMDENSEYDHYTSGFDEAVTIVEDFPSADVAPVVHGRWVLFHSEAAGDIQYCSACEIGFDAKMAYCPHCGAKMDEGE